MFLDEQALVRGALEVDYVFTTRTPHNVIVKIKGVETQYEILNVIEFTSERKRMSVIVRTPEGKIKLYSKGADNVIYERLKPANDFRDMTVSHLERFATDGLRTLCCAVKEIDENTYKVKNNNTKKLNILNFIRSSYFLRPKWFICGMWQTKFGTQIFYRPNL